MSRDSDRRAARARDRGRPSILFRAGVEQPIALAPFEVLTLELDGR